MSETLVKIRQVEGLREELNDLGSGGLGGAVSQLHGNADFSNGSPVNDRVAYVSSDAGGWNLGAGRFTLSFDFFSDNYFSQNPDGHFAIITRCPTALLDTAIRGQGMILGNVSGALNGSSVFPTAQIETFFGGLAAPGNRLLPNTGTYDPLVDGVTYRILLSSSIRSDGTQWIRYQIYQFDGAEVSYDPIRDTGDILDYNPFIDMTQTGFAFLHVFENGLAAPWSVNIGNVRTLWEAASQSNATGHPTLDLGGVAGQDYTLVGSELSIRSATVPFNNNDPFRIKDFRANTGTQVVIQPNGTNRNTGIVCSNASSWTAPWGYAKVGMTGDLAVLETFSGNGGILPPMSVQVGSEKWRWSQTFTESFQPVSFKIGGVEVVAINTGGLNFPDATKQSTAAGGVAFRAYTTASPALTNGADNFIAPDAVSVNTGGGSYNTGLGIYTVDKPGNYKITAQVSFEAVTNSITLTPFIAIRKNGGTTQDLQSVFGDTAELLSAGASRSISVSAIFPCVAGDTLRAVSFITFSGAGTCRVSSNTGGYTTQLLIERI